MEGEGMREEKSSEMTKLPPGFRFHPTDDELVFHYLCRKVAKQDFPSSVIAEVDLYKYDPWDLPSKAFFGKHEWYFFTCRDRKYPKGSRPSRSAGSGYWKVTGAEKPISSSSSSRHTAMSRAGVRKALVFYQGKAPRGVKTDWIMHEYRLADRGLLSRKPDNVVGAGSEGGTDKNKAKGPWQEEWVLCRLYNKQDAWVTRKTMHAEEAEEYFRVEPEDGVDAQLQPQPNPNPNLSLQPVLDQGYNAVDVAPSTEVGAMASANVDEDVDWFADLELDEL